MIQVKAYRGSEIRRFEIESGTTFAQLKKSVCSLFGLNKEDLISINYCDREEDVVVLSSDLELRSAFKHLGEENTWKLLIVEKQQERDHQPKVLSWRNFGPFNDFTYCGNDFLYRQNLDNLFEQGLWYSYPWRQQYQARKQAQTSKAHFNQCSKRRIVGNKRPVDEVEAGDEVAEKRPKVAQEPSNMEGTR